jgi:hypothetical protein
MDCENCSACNSSLQGKNSNVFCATCKAKFCSSKCKQVVKKKHGGGRCTLVPTHRNLGRADNAPLSALEFQTEDGSEALMLIDPDVEELICGGVGEKMALRPLKNGGYGPVCPAWRVFQLMNDVAQHHREFLYTFLPEENRLKRDEKGKEIPDPDRRGNLFVFTFTDFEDFACMYLDLGGKIAAAKNASGRRFEEQMTKHEIITGKRRYPTLECFTAITLKLAKRFAFNIAMLGYVDMLMGMGCDVMLVCVETETVSEIPTGELCYDLCRIYPWAPGPFGLFHLLRNTDKTVIDIACMDKKNPSARKGEALVGDIDKIAPDAYENHRIWLQDCLNLEEGLRPPHIAAIWDVIEGQTKQYEVKIL